MDNGIIKNLHLSEVQVLEIVKEWYTNGMFADILMDEEGFELDEICEMNIDALTRDDNYEDIQAYNKLVCRALFNDEKLSEHD